MTHQELLLDVREDLRTGRAPCSKIMDTAGRCAPGDTLRLIAPFEPVPLYEVLGREGFAHESRALGGGDWEVRFTRNPDAATAQLAELVVEPPEATGCGCGCAAAESLELDLRGLEPPQPMVRVLETLATLPADITLHAWTDRQPMHLLDQLEARGFAAHSKESPHGGYITVIRRR